MFFSERVPRLPQPARGAHDSKRPRGLGCGVVRTPQLKVRKPCPA